MGGLQSLGTHVNATTEVNNPQHLCAPPERPAIGLYLNHGRSPGLRVSSPFIRPSQDVSQ